MAQVIENTELHKNLQSNWTTKGSAITTTMAIIMHPGIRKPLLAIKHIYPIYSWNQHKTVALKPSLLKKPI